MSRRASLLALAALCASACATTQSVLATPEPPAPFTTEAELKQLAQAPLPAPPRFEPVVEVSEWSLVGPLPEVASHEPHPNATPFDAHVLKAVEGRVPTSADLACVARETAHFVAVKKGRPPSALARYIAGRCGSTAPLVETAWVEGKPDGDDDALALKWADQLDHLLITLRSGVVVGTGFAREEDDAVWAIAWSKESLELADVPLVPKDGKLRVEGKAQSETLEVRATLEHGELGFVRCEADPAVAPPRFAFDCPAEAGDALEWLSLSAREVDGVLGSEESRVLLMPSGVVTAPWRPRDPGAKAAPLPETLLDRVNALRAKAGLSAVRLAEGESKQLDALAPHYFAALQAGDAALRHQIAAGVVAGWSVGEPISQGGFSAAVAEQPEAGALVAKLLDDPRARAELLSPDVSLVALGVWTSPEAAGVLVGTYRSPLKVAALDADRELVAQLDAGRVAHKARPCNWVVPQAQVSQDLIDRLAQGDARPDQVLDEMLQISIKQLKVQAHGWHLEREGLKQVTFPLELLTEQPLDLWVVVLPYRPRHHPWTQWALFFVSLSGNLKEVGAESGS